MHSPDPVYAEKLTSIRLSIKQSEQQPGRTVVLFQDELTYYRQPTLAQTWYPAGPTQSLAELGYKSNGCWRLAATLDPWAGSVLYRQGSHIGIEELVRFYEQLAAAYPAAQRILLVQDNWPIHFHPDVLAALVPQEIAWPLPLPKDWPTEPTKRARYLNLPVYPVRLPTYASWCNPIEKLWRLLRQELLHVHRFEDDFAGLRREVARFMHSLADRREEVRRYVGLGDPLQLYSAVIETAGRAPP